MDIRHWESRQTVVTFGEHDRTASVTTKMALKICAGCPVRQQCLDDEMGHPLSAQNGIRGGLTAADRRQILHQREIESQGDRYSNLHHCSECGRPMHPVHARIAEYPDTITYYNRTTCRTCHTHALQEAGA